MDKINLHNGLVKIIIKARLCYIDDIFVFFPSNAKTIITHTLFFLKKKDCSKVEWLFKKKTQELYPNCSK